MKLTSIRRNEINKISETLSKIMRECLVYRRGTISFKKECAIIKTVRFSNLQYRVLASSKILEHFCLLNNIKIKWITNKSEKTAHFIIQY